MPPASMVHGLGLCRRHLQSSSLSVLHVRIDADKQPLPDHWQAIRDIVAGTTELYSLTLHLRHHNLGDDGVLPRTG